MPLPLAIKDSSKPISINKHLPFAILYFFLNILFLPFGLTWTAVLGPIFYIYALKKEKHDVLFPFLCLLSPFLIAHIISGVNETDYFVSILNLVMVFLFSMAVRSWLRHAGDHSFIFTRILYINFFLCLFALILYFTPFQSLTWIRQNITAGVQDFPRLKMFTYEASHYAMLFVPVFLFFFWQYLLKQNRIPKSLLLLMITLPLILSFSFGVIGSLFLSLCAIMVLNFRVLAKRKRILNLGLSLFIVLCSLFIILFIFYPGNIFFERIANIFSGHDSSAEGRTADAFRLAVQILSEHNASWFGIGPGQLKFLGADLIREYYLYYETTSVAIPNVAAETLLLFGWVGLGLRMLILGSLFYFTRVWSDYFRLSLFLFMFIYQFTGSYITNPGEWVIWVMAFSWQKKWHADSFLTSFENRFLTR